ncbi:MAG: YSC84-related protein [Burkholderiaceae bacterium]
MDRRLFVTAAAAGSLLAVTGCTTTPEAPADKATKRREIDAAADAALARLAQAVPDSRNLAARSRGILVFPNVLAGGFVVGGEYGDGVLRVQGRSAGYYRTLAGTLGFQIGGQSKAIIMMFMTPEVLEKFRNSEGWSVGGDASVAVANVGANGEIDTTTANQSVVAFVMTNAGLMANLNLQGSKITKLDL